MDEVVEALEKYQGLVPLVYDIEIMGLAEARPQDMPYAVYLKREADNVIAEKDEKIDELQKATDSAWSRVNAMYDEICHHKYKRCLAMARWCRMNDEFIQLESERLGLPQSTLFLEYRRKAMWWNKWRNRWLELAEKFKEAK